jgi:primosomal protein N' (replication factor Y)
MTSAARSASPEILSGLVDVCVDRPVLSLDRPFTYELAGELRAGIGSLVQVPFHGRAVRGWILGPATEPPPRVLPIKKVVSSVRFFDAAMLELLRRVSERYVAPLASVIERSVPPRVVSEEVAGSGVSPDREVRFAPSARAALLNAQTPPGPPRLGGYHGGPRLATALAEGAGVFIVRPAPADEQAVAVEAVARTLAGSRSAILLVPEVDPLPATAAAVLEAFGDDAVLFGGGSKRSRYRTWLEIANGLHRIVVGTRPAVFAPVRDLGMVFVSRESHAGHREERSPYFHVRDVAVARASLHEAVCLLSALCPSSEAASMEAEGVRPAGRTWPPVEVVRPGPEGRAPRLVSTLRSAKRAFLYSPLPGAGIARVCRRCGEPAACAACAGPLRAEGGRIRCVVCGSEGRCARCGATRFGIASGGAERVEAWVSRATGLPVRRSADGSAPGAVGAHEVLVGGAEAVKDVGTSGMGLDVVALLDVDLAGRRPGLSARERALATWMEAAAWACPSGRVIAQTRAPNDAAVQALVTGNPDRFHRDERVRRADAGFPVGAAVFRVAGSATLPSELETLRHGTLLVTSVADETLCLLALEPGDVPAFGRAMRDLAARGIVSRVEAEPHL